MPERCVCCGEIIPEGRQVCPTCDQKAATIQCKMTGHLVELPCSASGCPLFGDCLSEHKRITRTPQTNADRIRAMSDEELEAFLINVDLDKAGSPFINEWGKWLKQPAEEVH